MGLPVTVQMLKSTNDWREVQLKWYKGTTIEQDHQLESFVKEHNIVRIGYQGSGNYLEQLLGNKQTTDLDLCVYYVNQPFEFGKVVQDCNKIINESLSPNGFLYLTMNKFLAVPEYFENSTEDYDESIFVFLKEKINASVVKYHSGKLDGGIRFNWVHPLTRIYFKNVSSV